jgi:uncharacterized protein (DUF924 family)
MTMTQAEGRQFDPEEVLDFWRHAGPTRWFTKDPGFDEVVRERFGPYHDAAARGLLNSWQDTAEHTLALIIVLDQFPRNIYRDDFRAYSTDGVALAIAHRAISRGLDKQVPDVDRRFFYLPFMHSENLEDQERCITLCRESVDAEGLRFAQIHTDIIRRFGRFPHRNRSLGRRTTPEEQAFLDAGGFTG